MTPRVSVIMPVLNGERFIAEAVHSVLVSDFRDLELLVLDDGSTDRSVERALTAASGDGRVRAVALAHGGVARARNVGLREARGEFIANLDADDAMFPERLTRQVDFLDRHRDHVVVGSRVLVVDATGRPVGLGARWFTHEAIDRAHMEGRGGAIWNPTAMFRKEAAISVGAYCTALDTVGEDHDLWLRLAEFGRLANMYDVLVRYRVHDANVSLAAAHKERRHAVALENVRRALLRRGISGRAAVRVAAPPFSKAERACERALLAYYSGDRRGALVGALAAGARDPLTPVIWHAIRTMLRGPPPIWDTPGQSPG